MPVAPSRDRVRGALLGLALGDAMGMPVDGLSHQNVRTYYKGIKGLSADEKRRDLGAGQWTAHTQRAFALTRALTASPDDPKDMEAAYVHELKQEGPLRRWRLRDDASAAAAATAAPLGVWRCYRADWHSEDEGDLLRFTSLAFGPLVEDAHSITAAVGLAYGIASSLRSRNQPTPQQLVRGAMAVTGWAELQLDAPPQVSRRLRLLSPHLDEMPLDLQDRCNGTGDRADEAFPFALAMVARGPDLVEATLLSAVNVGGAASAVGAMVGALLGAFNGWSAFPEDWRAGLEDADRLLAEADALADALGLGD